MVGTTGRGDWCGELGSELPSYPKIGPSPRATRWLLKATTVRGRVRVPKLFNGKRGWQPSHGSRDHRHHYRPLLGYGTRAHPLGLNLLSTHSLGHQSNGFGFVTSLLGKPKTHELIDDSTTRRLLLSSPFDLLHSRLCVLERRAVHVISMTHQVELGDPQDSISCSFHLYLLRFAPKCPCFH
ncbi:hypothetical protein H5410_021542 [Solanum commersonii]|uniref:Uncharacterized protein n=1 Tax=Solanum commersonii TaxID=4109 RepID=A0A9J5ZCV9_SOLCO|nr:hypothetical protein H5410_021542 [Solanum commersonii]